MNFGTTQILGEQSDRRIRDSDSVNVVSSYLRLYDIS